MFEAFADGLLGQTTGDIAESARQKFGHWREALDTIARGLGAPYDSEEAFDFCQKIARKALERDKTK